MADSLVGVMVYYWGTNKLFEFGVETERRGKSIFYDRSLDSYIKPMRFILHQTVVLHVLYNDTMQIYIYPA